MKATQVRPTGRERVLGDDDVIVTKTDPRGVITYANPTFLRISALDEADTVGQPHNLIRHPDMPRAIFKLLWDTLKERKEVFAYVVNLAHDGAHYWVLAHITPSFDPQGRPVGYHSFRRRADPAAVAEIRKLYAALRAEEQRHTSSPAALEASWALLQRTLAEKGRTYDEFVWDLTNRSAS
ncbi:chemotaxis protein [Actinoplanes sp. NBRC 14428]|uniref:PAS domain S-box-containing protein n=1 Tax=Pseudosporangium ferrugineum TaxID=439699 RepID=A0A2T0SD15_9ACTN|nr:PAS domain-containing protein [Pseudosporangium ferrugineum]PRY31320.1 PAS domain S-box-containing protein [Pseudosporangium ferrugineum]BCJ54543.1 chemotaxis protein [Actinoplanes sp. NBRC 14428]